MTRPLIGITTWRRFIDTDLGTNRPVHSLGTEYAAPVEAAGGAVVLLPPTAGVDEVLDRIDGLVLSGGQDVHPGRYGAQAQDGQSYDPDRDEYEITLARGARERGLPVLAICRGMQLANVAFGGTLLVDIPASDDHHPVRGADEQMRARHPITIAESSRLAALYGSTSRVVNTIHHQAVDALAPELRAVAWSSDGVIEAVETDGDWPFWAVQWHPEKMIDPREAAEELPLFAAFVAAAHERAAAELTAAKKGTR